MPYNVSRENSELVDIPLGDPLKSRLARWKFFEEKKCENTNDTARRISGGSWLPAVDGGSLNAYYARYGVSENFAAEQKNSSWTAVFVRKCCRVSPTLRAIASFKYYIVRKKGASRCAPVAGGTVTSRFFPSTRWMSTRVRRASPRISRANIIYEYEEPVGSNVHGRDHNLRWKMVPHPWGVGRDSSATSAPDEGRCWPREGGQYTPATDISIYFL